MRTCGGGASPRACAWPSVGRRGGRPARALGRGGLREPREALLRIGEIAAIRVRFAAAGDEHVESLARAFRNATHEILPETRARVTRLAAQIPRVAREPRGPLHAGAAICIYSFAAVALLACSERARFAIDLGLPSLVAQQFRPAAHRPRRARLVVAGIALCDELLQ